MCIKLVLKLLTIAVFLGVCSWGTSQVAPAASGGGQSARLTLGAGYSNFTMDWGPSHRSDGISAWLDYYPFDGAAKNLGIEAEGRTSQWRNPIPQLREDTGQLGIIYRFRSFNRVHPYGKFLAGAGSMDFPRFPGGPSFRHTTVFVDSIAGGGEIRAYRKIWLRGEYQYQWWHNVYGRGLLFTPSGVTVGLQYDFRNPR